MTTSQMVFERAMHLMDEVNESSGKADTADTKEYKNRAIAILNTLRIECYPYSDTYTVKQAGKRPICAEITDFETAIDLDDGIAQGVLPYGLAAHLLLEEKPDMASFFNARYMELAAAFARSIPAQSEAIENPYGGIELGAHALW